MAKRILFTSSIYPYPTLPNDTSLTDATGARFTRADGIFGIISHSHHFATMCWPRTFETPRSSWSIRGGRISPGR